VLKQSLAHIGRFWSSHISVLWRKTADRKNHLKLMFVASMRA
jgi:hypothetical protein